MTDCLIRVSVLLYQAEESGKRGNTSIPFNYIWRCVVHKDMQTVELEFRPEHHEFIGAKSWKIKLKDPLRVQEFVKAVRTRVLQKGTEDMKARQDAATMSTQAWADALFLLKFEDESKAFAIEEDKVACNQGQVVDLMYDFRAMKKASIEAGRKGELSHNDITDLQTRGLNIVADQLGDVKGSLQHHMDLLVTEQQLMINLTAQADDLTQQEKELLAQNDGCCTMCGCTCTVM
eukprot:TRINITY_DN49519_c0_g1_i1.p2 TRINITY_DN49519_c0_g1~~TRINITY_DN49519_c0_g1_i1.p2  ORF type:complete len:233 (-),score=89.20 TRINITY_DN49519_c0_g1_i1:83-781(-)